MEALVDASDSSLLPHPFEYEWDVDAEGITDEEVMPVFMHVFYYLRQEEISFETAIREMS